MSVDDDDLKMVATALVRMLRKPKFSDEEVAFRFLEQLSAASSDASRETVAAIIKALREEYVALPVDTREVHQVCEWLESGAWKRGKERGDG